ncbi:hypothetical protein BGAL_0399g00070 [Botrytis galanthina]|uniref:Uncharacterized protein n=1 Tax=Botrytis galanthina TaxID=278940 RepID=A0A4S8QMN0_9HELO|nr:hypothetical protein BGAL_0399g00070 [Botrytis galanthina]
MSSPRGTVRLTVLISPSKSQYLYLPAEKNSRGKLVRQVIILRKSNLEIKEDDVMEPSEYEKTKCHIRDDVKAKDLLEKVEKLRELLSKDEDPKRKVNRVTTAWASEGWLYDDNGNRLSAYPPAPSEQPRANTDASKNTKEKKKLFGNTLPPITKEEIAKSEASVKAKDGTRVSSNLPTSSRPRKDKKVGPFLETDSEESDPQSLFVPERKSAHSKSAADGHTRKVGTEKDRTVRGKQPIRNDAFNKIRDGKNTSNPLSTSSKPTDANTTRRGPFLSDSESDPDSLFVSERKPRVSKSAADDRTKKSTRNPLARELFPSDEEENPKSLASHPRSKTTGGGKTREPPQPAKKKTTMTYTDLAGDDSYRRERVRATGESSRGTLKKRDAHSRSPDRPPKKTDKPQGGDSSRTSSRKSRPSKTRTGDGLAPIAGVFYESRGDYTSGRRTWSNEDPNRPPTEREIQDMDLEDAENMWKKNHGTEL